MQATVQRRSSTFTAVAPPPLRPVTADLFSDSRFHGYQGPSRNVRLPRASTNGGGTVAKSEDGVRCVVAGRECSSNHSFSRPVLPDNGVEQPCASFVCRIQETQQPRSKSRALGLVGIASICPRTSGMGAGSRLKAQAPMLRGVAAVSISFQHDPRRGLRSSTDYNNKILTSARNGDLIMWDLDKPGSTKYGTCL